MTHHPKQLGLLSRRFWLTVLMAFMVAIGIAMGDLSLVNQSVLTKSLMTKSLVTMPTAIAQQLAWGDIFRGLRRKKPPHGSRGEVCILSPAELENMSRTTDVQPKFLWQGFARAIALRNSAGKEIWRDTINKTSVQTRHPSGLVFQFPYAGTALQSGKPYTVILEGTKSAQQLFQIVPKIERERIAADLKTLEVALNKDGASQEAIALQRATYFAKHQLWSNAVQEVYSVKNPSAELKQVAQQLSTQICHASS